MWRIYSTRALIEWIDPRIEPRKNKYRQEIWKNPKLDWKRTTVELNLAKKRLRAQNESNP